MRDWKSPVGDLGFAGGELHSIGVRVKTCMNHDSNV